MDNSLTFGWEEWISLPKLGLPALKAKIDTGAHNSALHAFGIETFGSNQNLHVRFMVHPIPGAMILLSHVRLRLLIVVKSHRPMAKANLGM